MAFKFGAFARGFAEAAVADKREKETEVKEIIKTSYTQALQEAKELRKERKAKREQLKNIGNQLKMMDMTDSQVAGVLAKGVDGAKKTLELLQATALEYGKQNKTFNVNDFVSASTEANITIEDAVDRVMGTLKVAEGGAKLPSLAQQDTFFGSMDKFTERQLGQLQEGFGEDLGALQAEIAGQYEYGELPKATVDIAKMGLPDPMADLNKRAKELEIQIAEAELEKESKATPMKSTDVSRARKEILGELSAKMQLDLKYDPDNDIVYSPTATNDQLVIANQLARQGITLMNAFGGAKDYGSAYNKTIQTLFSGIDATQSGVVGGRGGSGGSGGVTGNVLPQYNSSQTPAAYINAAISTLNVTAMNPRAKAGAKATIRNQLIAGGMSAVDANKEVNKLIP